MIAVPRGAEGASGPVRFAAAGHPVPDIFSLAAAREILSLLERAGKGDLVVALVSGGGSAMLSSPAAGITMEEKAETFRLLLRAGADIASFQRRAQAPLRESKGGLLARAAQPADRMGAAPVGRPRRRPFRDRLRPLLPRPERRIADAIGVLERYTASITRSPPRCVATLPRARAAPFPETPKQDDPAFLGQPRLLVGRTGRRWTGRC